LLDAKYAKADSHEVIEQQNHLYSEQRQIHGEAFRIPHSIKPVLKKEVDKLVKIGLLSPNKDSKWTAPSFVIPKKDGTIRFISDFRQLDKRVLRNTYPLPHMRVLLDSTGVFV